MRSAPESAHPLPVYMRQAQTYREPDRLLTTRVVAERLGVKPTTLRRWAREGRVPSYRVGRKTLRFDLADVFAAIREGVAHD